MKMLAYMILIAAVSMTAAVSFAEEKCKSVSDAKKLWSLNRQREAILCLNELKTDVEANFLLGELFLQNGNRQEAKDRLSAPAVKKTYGAEIYQLYKNTGDSYANQSNFDEAGNMYEEAVAYKADARQPIALEMFERGKSTGKRGYCAVAKRLDKSLAPQIGEYYHALSLSKKTASEQIEVLEYAAADDPRYERELQQKKEVEGRGALEQAKVFARKPGQEAAAAKYKALAKKYLGEAIVDQELPHTKAYTPGTYYFTLNAGEQTEYWITFPTNGKIPHWKIGSKDDKFQIVYDDGQIVPGWTDDPMPANKYTFRFVAVTGQQTIKMAIWY